MMQGLSNLVLICVLDTYNCRTIKLNYENILFLNEIILASKLGNEIILASKLLKKRYVIFLHL